MGKVIFMNDIQKSINRHYTTIMKDMNSSVRIVVEGRTEDEDKTYISRIIDWENNRISFHAPLVLGEYVRLSRTTTYPFIIVTESCIYTTSVKINEFLKNDQGHYYYRAVINSAVQRNQQRKYFRLDWINPFKYKTQNSDEYRDANTIDISVGGILMASKREVYKDDSINIHISLLDEDFVLNGVVLESLGKRQTGLYVARVQFHDMSRKTENKLSQIIMKHQRNLLKNS